MHNRELSAKDEFIYHKQKRIIDAWEVSVKETIWTTIVDMGPYPYLRIN